MLKKDFLNSMSPISLLSTVHYNNIININILCFKGALTNDPDKKKITARAMIDDTKEYSFTSEVAIQKTKLNTRYTPLVEVSLPGKRPYRLTGDVLYRPGKKIDVDLSLVNVFRGPISVNGMYQIVSYLQFPQIHGIRSIKLRYRILKTSIITRCD